VRKSNYRHDPLLIDRLVAFNFRPRLILQVSSELVRTSGFSQ